MQHRLLTGRVFQVCACSIGLAPPIQGNYVGCVSDLTRIYRLMCEWEHSHSTPLFHTCKRNIHDLAPTECAEHITKVIVKRLFLSPHWPGGPGTPDRPDAWHEARGKRARRGWRGVLGGHHHHHLWAAAAPALRGIPGRPPRWLLVWHHDGQPSLTGLEPAAGAPIETSRRWVRHSQKIWLFIHTVYF